MEEMSKYEARDRRMMVAIRIDSVNEICSDNNKHNCLEFQEIGQDRFVIEYNGRKLFEGCFAELNSWCNGFIAGIRHK